jgi:hypothetical protein
VKASEKATIFSENLRPKVKKRRASKAHLRPSSSPPAASDLASSAVFSLT